MPTIKEVYDPLITAAVSNDIAGYKYLASVGESIFKANPDRCPNIEDGIEAAKRNLDYYCQYFDLSVTTQVKKFYELGEDFRAINGKKIIGLI